MEGKKTLSNEELEGIVGGNGAMSELGEVQERYCKYCNKTTLQFFDRRGMGYDTNGDSHDECHLWECLECKNTNYYDPYLGELI